MFYIYKCKDRKSWLRLESYLYTCGLRIINETSDTLAKEGITCLVGIKVTAQTENHHVLRKEDEIIPESIMIYDENSSHILFNYDNYKSIIDKYILREHISGKDSGIKFVFSEKRMLGFWANISILVM